MSRMSVGLLVLVAAVGGAPVPLSGQGAGSVGGRVVTSTGELLRDATVSLRQESGQGWRELQRATTAADGTFHFARVPAGRYSVVAAKAGYTMRQAPPPGVPGPDSAAGPEVDVGTSVSPLDVEVLLLRAGRISGRVVDLDGSGVRASLVLHRLSDTRVSSIAAFLRTAPDGRYAQPDLPPGNYLIEATVGTTVVPSTAGPGARPTESQVRRAIALAAMDVRRAWYPGVTERQTAATLTLAEGEQATDVDIWLPSQPRSGVVGQVAWPVGVQVESITIDYGDPAGTRSGMWVVSDPEGHFALTGIRPGPLVLLAHVKTDQGLLMGAASIDFSGDSILDVPLVVDRPGVVEGRVTYPKDMPATARATTLTLVQKRMRVTALYPAPIAVVNPDGRFRAADALGDFEVELRGLPAGYAVSEVRRGTTALAGGRIAVGGGETVTGIEVVVSRSR